MVRVSVVVPVYNPGEHIGPLLDSLLGQTLPADECELVFVDDGSTDGTAERLAALAAAHPHVRLAHVPRSGWPGRPRNVGLEMARGEYVFFADHDDRLGVEALERLCGMAVADDADVVIGKVVGHRKGVPRDVFRANRHGIAPHEAPFSLLAPHKLFRRDLLERHRVRFPDRPQRLEDHAFVVPALLHARRISVLADYACYHWMRRPDKGNASLHVPEMHAYYDAVRAVLDIIDAHVEPGPFRERLYLRWYRGKVLGQVGHARFARWAPERQRNTVEAARAIALERFPRSLDAGLTYAQRMRATLLRAGDLEGLAALGRFAGGLRAVTRVRDVRGDGTWLTLRVVGRLDAAREAVPLRIDEVDGRHRFRAPDDLAANLTSAQLDVTQTLSDPAVVVYLKSLDDGAEWDLPTERRLRLVDADGGGLRPQLGMLARVAPTVAAAGAPLPPGEYEVHAIVAVAGFVASARVRREGNPFRITVTPALRLEHWRPAPPRASRRRRLARAARRVPGLVRAVRWFRRVRSPARPNT